MKRLVLCVLALALVLPAAAIGDPITLVTYYQAKDRDGNTLVEHMKKYGIDDVLNAQLGAGNVTSWGVANRTLDGPEFSHITWVTYPNWTSWEAATEAFEAHFKELGEEGAGSQQALQELIEGMDEMVLRHTTYEVNPEVRPEFLMTSVFRAKPGKGGEAAAWMEAGEPVNAQLMADGVITGYGTFVQDFHTDPGWTQGAWVTFTGLDKLDAIGEAYQAASSDESRAARAEAMDRSGHYDELYWIVFGPGMDDDEKEEE